MFQFLNQQVKQRTKGSQGGDKENISTQTDWFSGSRPNNLSWFEEVQEVKLTLE